MKILGRHVIRTAGSEEIIKKTLDLDADVVSNCKIQDVAEAVKNMRQLA